MSRPKNGAEIDLTQFWIDRKDLAACPKKYGAWYGVEYLSPPANSDRVRRVFRGDEDSTFCATTLSIIQSAADGSGYVAVPASFQIQVGGLLAMNHGIDQGGISLSIDADGPWWLVYPIVVDAMQDVYVYMKSVAPNVNTQVIFGGIRVYP